MHLIFQWKFLCIALSQQSARQVQFISMYSSYEEL